MNLAFLMITPPHQQCFLPEGNFILPPLALGTFAEYFRKKGYTFDIEDLNGKFSHTLSTKDKERFRILFNRQKVINYLRGSADSEIDTLLAEILDGIDLEKYNGVGISVGADFSLFQINLAFLAGEYIFKKYKLPVVLGGNNITYLYLFRKVFRELWEAIFYRFKYIVKGPGIKPLAQILKNLENPPGIPPEEIEGLVFQKEGRLVANAESGHLLLRPDFSTLDLDSYCLHVEKEINDEKRQNNLIFGFKWPHFLTQYVNSIRSMDKPDLFEKKRIIPYIFNYNCPFRCAFCTESDEKRSKIIFGKVEDIIGDIKHLMEKYETDYFYFLNNTFNVTPGFTDRLCKGIKESGLKFYWSDCARFNNLTYDRLKNMKEVGCQKLVFGFETASPKILEYVDKKLDLEQAKRVLKWCKELHIWADLEIIVGFPYEMDEDFKETENFILENRGYINYMTINTYFVVPNSLIGSYPERYGISLQVKKSSYEKILTQNADFFFQRREIGGRNFALYQFDEIKSGRSYKEIRENMQKYVKRLNELQNKEFDEVEYVYKIKEQILSRKKSDKE